MGEEEGVGCKPKSWEKEGRASIVNAIGKKSLKFIENKKEAQEARGGKG